MKKFTTALLSIPLLLACSALCSCDAGASGAGDNSSEAASTTEAKPSPRLKRNQWQLESAKIEYRFTGAFDGTQIHHFDKHGDTYVITTDRTEFMNEVQQTSIWNDKKTTIYKHKDPSKSAWQGRMRVRETEPSSSSRLTQKQMESVGYTRLADEEIAGKTCAVYDNKNLKVKIWLWNGIELKVINHSIGLGYTKEAVSVKAGTAVPASAIALPAGYKIGK